MTDVVLLHSTGQSTAGWGRVSRVLEARGATVHGLDLPNDPTLRVRDFSELLAGEFADLVEPVVVAHSGAGLLLPATARALGARLQVWVAALVPDPEASLMEELRVRRDEMFNPDWIGKDPVADAAVAEAFLYHDCDAQTLAWALSTRREFYPEAVYDERIELAPGIRSVYIVAAHDRTIRPEWQRMMARQRLGVQPIEIPTGHCPNVSRPAELAEILLREAA